MKYLPLCPISFWIVTTLHGLAEPTATTTQHLHQEGAAKIADQQDELAADVQQLTIEQTVPPVIELFKEVESIMNEATDHLAEAETGGVTIAAQTEIIEKIHGAAKERQKQNGGGGQAGSAMMDMMERMMGAKPEGDDPGKGKAQPGNGQAGGPEPHAETTTDALQRNADGKNEARRVPKTSGTTGQLLPEEFRKALDAYNRGMEAKIK